MKEQNIHVGKIYKIGMIYDRKRMQKEEARRDGKQSRQSLMHEQKQVGTSAIIG